MDAELLELEELKAELETRLAETLAVVAENKNLRTVFEMLRTDLLLRDGELLAFNSGPLLQARNLFVIGGGIIVGGVIVRREAVGASMRWQNGTLTAWVWVCVRGLSQHRAMHCVSSCPKSQPCPMQGSRHQLLYCAHIHPGTHLLRRCHE